MPDPDPASMTLTVILSTLLLWLVNLLFQLCDEAFAAVGETRIRELEEDGNRKAAKIRKLTEKERQFTARIRLGTLLCGATAAVLLVVRFYPALSTQLADLFGVMANAFTRVLSCGLLILLTLLLFGALGSILPRRLVHRDPESAALTLVDLFGFFHALLYPLYGLGRMIAWPIVKIAGMDPGEDPETVTEDDILELIEDVEETGALEESQKDMLNNIFEFDDITAAEIMTPRTDVTAIEVTAPLADAVVLAIEHGYSRLPVYEEDIDHILGILYIKDLLPYVGRSLPKTVTIRRLLRETYFVPDTKKCDELFEEMNEKHLQLSIVVDEYGGVAGIVTIEDLLESIVGNMQDEFDHEEEEVTQLDEDSFEVDGTLSISELGELLDLEFPVGDYDTVAGFLLDRLGHIPEEEEEAVVEYENLTMTVLKMDERRIEQILIHRDPIPASPEEEE